MRILKNLSVYACMILLTCAVFNASASAGGPPLKDSICGTCHQDYSVLAPQSHLPVGKGASCLSCHPPDQAKNEATKFSAHIHKVHQSEKIKLTCSACHAL